MSLDELKTNWNQQAAKNNLDEQTLNKMIKARIRKNFNATFQYFWMAFVYLMIVFASLSHVIVKYWGSTLIVLSAIAGVILFIPFTVILMRKFKAIASVSLKASGGSVRDQIQTRYNILESFYQFKKRYDLLQVPVATMICIYLVFELFVPGGIMLNLSGAATAFALSVIACIAAIKHENEKRFDTPLSNLRLILKDLDV